LILPLAGLSGEVAVTYETDLNFQGFPWGTSINDFIKKMGKPVSQERVNGLDSLLWENVELNGFTTYMIAYFSRAGLQGGTYYFVTTSMDEDIRCYSGLRQELRDRYGPTILFDGIIREMRAYECSWTLPGGYVYLMVNARQGDPVTLWYSSPELTRQIFGKNDPVTARK
jgi:hypothetical protein